MPQDVEDIISAAVDNNPLGVQTAFKDQMVQRIADALAGKREEVVADRNNDES